MMKDFFHGWRRKVGIVTLVMACVVCGLWVRSFYIMDILAAGGSTRQHVVESVNGRIWWTAYLEGAEWEFSSTFVHRAFPPGYLETILPRKMLAEVEGGQFGQWIIPYWSITIPLTLLSAYLILWKPRKPSSPG